ncbi:hypothetical protein QAD02_013648 [Eretmocerus hayati]|uniref:Uncharacterized protein n=1 Tax=Eretmocerus hayati TaxID=131215 RepID=A0ACC2P4V3_9HYME|nr:hypothetical protein QAD02_013648 [Eretmocerus hayati]
MIDDIQFEIEVMSIVADTPARAFIKCTKGHGGYCCCERCTVVGFMVDGTTIYPANMGTPRTDESFRNKEDEEHHMDTSPLLSIRPRIKMILKFVLDFMHLMCLGVTKKITTDHWLIASSKILSRTDILRLPLRLKNLNDQISVEFQRGTRALEDNFVEGH